MECKYCDDYTGICTNPECPMRGDKCPVPDVEGICKHEDREEVAYALTPKMCAALALAEVGLTSRIDDRRVDLFWEQFEGLMRKSGYVHEEDSDRSAT